MTDTSFGSLSTIGRAWRAEEGRLRALGDQNAAQPKFPVCLLTFLTFLLCKMGEALARRGFSIAIFAAQQNTALRNDAALRGVDTAMNDVHGHYLEDMSVGMTAVYTRTVTEADIVLFSGISGDANPVHLDQEFAKATMFKGRIAHGMLTASFISTVLGTKLPGPGCIYISQNLKFKAPVRIGDTVKARVTVTAVDQERGRITVATVCHVGDTQVIDGEAQLLVPRRPAIPQAAE